MLPFEITDELIVRFLSKVQIGNDDECWNWTAAKNDHGYGLATINKKTYSSHRISWMIYRGEIQNKLFVLHICDNPACVNPAHLQLGTQSDNIRDMDSKGRRGARDYSGENNASSKLNDVQVCEIRSLYATGEYSMRALASMFDVSPSTIKNIIDRTTWNHVCT